MVSASVFLTRPGCKCDRDESEHKMVLHLWKILNVLLIGRRKGGEKKLLMKSGNKNKSLNEEVRFEIENEFVIQK
jgi:hypothetical protein